MDIKDTVAIASAERSPSDLYGSHPSQEGKI